MFVRSIATLRLTLASVLGASLLTGCADMLTYSQDFKREGMKEYDRGDYVDAAGSFKAAARQDPTDYQTQYWLASSSELSGNYNEAIEGYELCLKLAPNTLAGHNDIQTHDKAIAHLASSIAKSDSSESEINSIQHEAQTRHSAEDYHILARIFAERGDPDSAVDSYRRAVSLAPDDFSLNKEYGMYLAKLNQTAEAGRVLRHAYDLNSGDAEVNNSLRHLGTTQGQAVPAASEIPPAPRAAAVSVEAPRD